MGHSGERGPVVVLGGINCDISAAVSGAITPGSSTPGQVALSPGGVGRNIAHNLALLHVPVVLAGAVGTDPLSEWLLEHAAAAGVDVDDVIRVVESGCGVYVSTLSGGELLHAVSDMRAIEKLSVPDVEQMLGSITRRHGHPSWLVVDCNLQPEVIQAALDWAADGRIEVMIEPVSVSKAGRLRGVRGTAYVCTPNAAEAVVLARQHDDRGSGHGSAGLDLRNWVITRGASGAAIWQQSEPACCELLATEAAGTSVNVNGAGDAFSAALVSALYYGADLRTAVRSAQAAGRHTVLSAETVARDLATVLRATGFYIPDIERRDSP